MVFKHEIDPSHGDEAHQKALGEVHHGLVPGSAAYEDANNIAKQLALCDGGPKFNC